MHLPDWLLKREPESLTKGVNRGGGYVQKTLARIANLMEEVVFSDEYAKKDGLLQKIDARAKLILILLVIAGTSFLRDIELILAIYGLVIIAAYLSKIDILFFIKRTWLFIPIFSGIVAIPAIFSFFTPGEPIVTLVRLDHAIGAWNFQFSELTITKEGVLGTLLFVFRIATSVSLALLLTLTTRWNVLMKSLRALGVPKMFVLILSMTYQYILILLRIVQEMHLAKKSRTIRADGSLKGLEKERGWVASRIGTVLMKSYAISEETHSAMVSRGFKGEVKS
ncbi:MAG: cobalt ECF transporter T component CbiQ [Candidatus Micrarchaeota archaeon]